MRAVAVADAGEGKSVSLGSLSASRDSKRERWLRNLEDDMKVILPYLDDKNVTDIAIGHNGQLIVEGLGMGKKFTGTYYDEATVTRIIYASAAVLGVTVDARNPVVEGTLKLTKWRVRFEGILPPRASERPMIFIRRPSDRIFTLEEYLEQGRISQEKYDLLVRHIERESNIIIGGSTGSGKTTLLNAILDKMRVLKPDDRFYIVEDAGEIQIKANDVVPVWAEGEDTVHAVRAALRCKVSRVIFGELRYGSTTNELLKAWNSGHKGNVTTIHADSALMMIEKIRSLLREVIPGEIPDVAQSVQLLVHMLPSPEGPFVSEVVETRPSESSSFLEELESNHLI